MTKTNKILGLITLVFLVSLICIGFILMSQKLRFSAFLVQLSILNLVLLEIFAGLFIMVAYTQASAVSKKILVGLGVAFGIFGTLSAFNIIDIHNSWNLLFAIGILYITVVQMQLLKWDKSKSILKVLGLITLLSNLFMIAYFAFKLDGTGIGTILDITVITSVFSFLTGLILSRKKVEA